MNIISWITGLFNPKPPPHEIDLNNNDYNPKSKYIIYVKKELLKALKKKKISKKEYIRQCSELKAGFKNRDLLNIPLDKFNNKTLKNSCIAQRNPNTKVFPDGIVNCTLVNWNTNNCIIPAGITLSGGSNKQVKRQNDGENWIVDKNLKPVSPLIPEEYDKYGLSKKPQDIPSQPLKQSIIITARENEAKKDRKNYIKTVASTPALLDKIIDENTLI